MVERSERRPGTGRDGALDGLRGIAIVLVVLSHGWTVYPFENSSRFAPFDSLLFAGNVAVTIFLVISGFLVTQSMLTARELRGTFGPWGPFLRRFLRNSSQVYVLIVAVWIMSRIDTTDVASAATTRDSLLHVVTYTWNWFVRAHPVEARGDLGPLWYLSVEMQAYLVLAICLGMWGAKRGALIAALVVLIPLVTWWRWYTFDTEGWYSALLRTSTRADGLLWGALLALVIPKLKRLRSASSVLVSGGALVMFAVVATSARFDVGAYMKGQGLLMALAVAAFVVGNHKVDPTNPVIRALSWRPLRVVGGLSLTIYIWHSPIFWALSRHTESWNNVLRTATAIVLVGVIATVAHRLIDRPVQRWTTSLGRPQVVDRPPP